MNLSKLLYPGDSNFLSAGETYLSLPSAHLMLWVFNLFDCMDCREDQKRPVFSSLEKTKNKKRRRGAKRKKGGDGCSEVPFDLSLWCARE